MDDLVAEQGPALTRRLARILGDPHAAEDLCQEAFARAWSSAPPGLSRDRLAAWLHRTATNLALDELRRRRIRQAAPLDDTLDGAAPSDPHRALHIREALARLTAHERLLLLLRFEGGLRHREIADLLALPEATARKRVSRARRALAAAMRETAADRRPRVALLVADGAPDTCEAWLAAAGADVTVLEHGRAGLTLAGADALVLSGSVHDVHPAVYGEAKGPDVGVTCLASDRRDLALVGQALADDLPLVGICRGSQLLNIALGGSLWQDLDPTSVTHPTDEPHPIRTGDGSPLRDIIGRTAAVGGAHHQAVRRLGRGVRPTAVSSDGVVESVDVPSRRFALGVQWHPESAASAVAGQLLADALVRAATHGAAPGGARPGSRSLVPSG